MTKSRGVLDPRIFRCDSRATSRECRRPERLPGVAPDCEDANRPDDPRTTPRPVTLPRLKFLEKSSG